MTFFKKGTFSKMIKLKEKGNFQKHDFYFSKKGKFQK